MTKMMACMTTKVTLILMGLGYAYGHGHQHSGPAVRAQSQLCPMEHCSTPDHQDHARGQLARTSRQPIAHPGTGRFALFTDLHLDPFYGTSAGYKCGEDFADATAGTVGCDSPHDLIEATIYNGAQVLPNPSFIVVAGDNVRHDGHVMPNMTDALHEIFSTVTGMLSDAFPNVTRTHASVLDSTMNIINTIGNNDVQPDYVMPMDVNAGALNPALALLRTEWEQLVESEQHDDFEEGGYYASTELSGRLLILSLNTVIYSIHHCNSGPAFACNHSTMGEPNDPLGQFAWLRAQLEQARSSETSVYILGHIPPVIQSYDRTAFWDEQYSAYYHDLVHEFADIIIVQLFGHTHSDEFRVLDPALSKHPPLLISSAITPIFGNQPSFKIIEYNETTLELSSYAMFVPHNWSSGSSIGSPRNSIWQELMNTSSTLGLTSLSQDDLFALANAFAEDDLRWTAYINTTHRAGEPHKSLCNQSCREDWSCLYKSFTMVQYKACLASDPIQIQNNSNDDKQTIIIVAVLLGSAGLLLTVLGLWYARRRYLLGRHNYMIVESGGDDTELLISEDTNFEKMFTDEDFEIEDNFDLEDILELPTSTM